MKSIGSIGTDCAEVGTYLRAHLAEWAGRTPDDGKTVHCLTPAGPRNRNGEPK